MRRTAKLSWLDGLPAAKNEWPILRSDMTPSPTPSAPSLTLSGVSASVIFSSAPFAASSAIDHHR